MESSAKSSLETTAAANSIAEECPAYPVKAELAQPPLDLHFFRPCAECVEAGELVESFRKQALPFSVVVWKGLPSKPLELVCHHAGNDCALEAWERNF